MIKINSLILNSLSYEVAGYQLFNNLNGNFNSGIKYGLVGPNGVGKSTLGLLISGAVQPSSGQMVQNSNIGYLSQIEVRPDCALSFYLQNIWDNSNDYPQLIAELIQNIDLNKMTSVLSGGEWMRVRIAKSLSQGFDFLILDEPTNNLDREGKNALYKFIKQYGGGLIIISHDRELLALVDQVVELSNQGLSFYGGHYDFYIDKKNMERNKKQKDLERLQHQSEKIKSEKQIKIARQEKRMRAGAKGTVDSGLPKIIIGARKRQAQVSMGKLLKQEEGAFSEIKQKIIDATKELKTDPFVRLDFEGASVPTGKTILSLEELNWMFDGQISFLWDKNLNFILKGQDRLHIQGNNGSGKSTLIKIILGNQNLIGTLSGSFKMNTQAVAYLDQNYELLNKNKSVLENVCEDSRFNEKELRNELAFFGFTKDKVFQKVSSLSGGEMLKAGLAKMFLSKQIPELIVLDEPTNNLDLLGIELLESALNKFKGALIIVSHDNKFAERLNPNGILNLG